MSVELSIFQVFCKEREKHLLHKGHVDGLRNMERELKLMFGLLDSYYKEFEDKDAVDTNTLMDYYELKYPKSREKADIATLMGNAFDIEINDGMVDQFLDQLKEKYVATNLVNQLMPVLEGDKYGVVAGLGATVEEYLENMHNPPEGLTVPEPCELGIGELIKREIREPGIPWRLPYITQIVGGLRPSTLGLIYAFVDSGKTSFCLDNVAAFATALAHDECVCYAGNEEEAPRLKLRAAQAFLKQRIGWFDTNEAEAKAILEGTNFDQIKFFDDIVSGDQIRYIMKTYNPRILIVDQATDVEIAAKRRAEGVEYMKQLFKWYRRLAHEFQCAIIGVSQGVGTAENTKWLKLSDIYGSRVAIQGALDYAIGIGRKVDDAAVEDQRYINIPKNKLNGGDGGRVTTTFTKQICEWRQV